MSTGTNCTLFLLQIWQSTQSYYIIFYVTSWNGQQHVHRKQWHCFCRILYIQSKDREYHLRGNEQQEFCYILHPNPLFLPQQENTVNNKVKGKDKEGVVLIDYCLPCNESKKNLQSKNFCYCTEGSRGGHKWQNLLFGIS